MGVLWTISVALIIQVLFRKKQLTLIIAGLVFSHVLLDFMASPKTAFYPNDTGMPVFLDTSVTIGLGLWKYKILAWICEYGILLGGIMIYIFTIRKYKVRKN